MSTILDRLARMAQSPDSAPRSTHFGHAKYIGHSDDLERVKALPRRPIPSEAERVEMARVMTERLKRTDVVPGTCKCAELRPEVVATGQSPCITELRPVQGWYLWEAAEVGGVCGLMAIGAGKTGADILAAMVFPGCRLAVLLISPTGVGQFLKDYEVWSQHFQVPNLVGDHSYKFPFRTGRPRLEIFPYSRLQLEQNATWFKERPDIDVVIGDEVQAVKDRKSTRTGRLLRFAAEPERQHVRYCLHSGSFTTREPNDCAHLLAITFKLGSPFAIDPDTAQEWSDAVNPKLFDGDDYSAGKLMELCKPGETLAHALHLRLVETKGVIATSDAAVDAKLVIKEAPTGPVPESVIKALRKLYNEEKRPDDEDLMDQLEVAAVASQLACGFYLRWRFPHGESRELINEWFDVRKAYAAEVRRALQHRTDGLDSPKLLRDAAERYHTDYKGPLPVWDSKHFKDWMEIKGQVKPEEGDIVWIDDFLARAAAKWALESPGIVWYQWRGFGARVEELCGGKVPRFGGGEAASAKLLEETGSRSVLASVKAHHKEKNLQFAFGRNLVANSIGDGGILEQTLGRTHRSKQPRKVVEAYFFRHLEEPRKALDSARAFASYIQQFTGNPQKLCYAEFEWERKGKRGRADPT